MVRRESSPAALRERLRTERLVGTFVKIGALEVVDLIALAGMDFAIIDLEHSQLSEDDARRLVRHARAIDLPAVVRIPSCDQGEVNRLLEAGAAGIQLSTVRSMDDVIRLVGATRYPPQGRRSVSLAHPVAGYGTVALRDAATAPPPLLVGQIETAVTHGPLEQILGILDVAFLGVTDLEVDLEFDPERVAERTSEIVKAAEAAGVTLGAYAPDPASIPAGARYVALSSDVALLRGALADASTQTREAGR